jgi:hypothetical protein
VGNFFVSCKPVSFSRTPLLHGVSVFLINRPEKYPFKPVNVKEPCCPGLLDIPNTTFLFKNFLGFTEFYVK